MNKIFNHFTMLLLSVMALTLGSCTEEYDYVGEKAKGQQVYFSNTLSSSVEITSDGAHFLVPINRVSTDEALTVNLASTDESGVLTIPQTVTFDAGQSETNITIDYDASRLTAETHYSVTLSIADEDYTTPYGESSYTFDIVLSPPSTSIGMGTFTDELTGVYNVPVEIRQIDTNPNQFRIMYPYANISETASEYLQFTVLHAGDLLPSGETVQEDGLVYFDQLSVGVDLFNGGYPDSQLWHPSLLVGMDISHNRVLAYQDNGLPGAVQLAPYLCAYTSGSSVYGQSFADVDGVITITFPDYVYDPKDYSVDVTYLGAFVSQDGNNYVMGNVTMGADVNEVHVGVVEGGDEANALNEALLGNVETTTVTENGDIRIQCDYSGECTLVALAYAYDENGELTVQNYATKVFNYSIAPSEWTSLGTGIYNDYVLGNSYISATDPETGEEVPYGDYAYYVEVQESKTTPGVYRLVNPYSPEVNPIVNQLMTDYWDSSRSYNIIINASDPEAVYISTQPIGINVNNDGMYILTVGGMYVDAGKPFDLLKQNGMIKGKLENGIISFDAGELCYTFDSDLADPNGYIYYAGVTPTTVLMLPSAVTQQAKANVQNTAKALKNLKLSKNIKKSSKVKMYNFKKKKTFAPVKFEKIVRK